MSDTSGDTSSSPPPSLRRLITGASWFVIGVLTLRMIGYGAVAFVDAPLIDDWFFTVALQRYLSGQVGPGYVLEPQNNHLAVPAHVAFWVDYHIFDLDYAALRWWSASLLGGLGALLAWSVARDVRTVGGSEPTFIPPVAFAVAPFALAVNLTHWETLSVAMNGVVVVCVLAVVAACALLEAWIARRSPVLLAGTIACALLASVSLGTGCLVWLCLSIQLLLSDGVDKRARWWLTAAFGAMQVVFLMIVLPASGKALAAAGSPLTALAGVVIVSATSVAPHLDNQPRLSQNYAYGVVILAFSLGATLWVLRHRKSVTRPAAKYLAIMLFGLIDVAAIAWGRRMFTTETYASSRYAVLSLPLLAGTFGLLAVIGSRRGWAAIPFVALFACVAAPLAIANVEETKMAPFRRATYMRMLDHLRDGAMPETREYVKQNFLVDDQFAGDVLVGRRFLMSDGLSFFEGIPQLPAGDQRRGLPGAVAPASAKLTAEPNPVPAGDGNGRTTIRWRTADGAPANVYVVDTTANGSESLFATAAEGEQVADWIQTGHVYEFRLYSEPRRLLASLRVTREP